MNHEKADFFHDISLSLFIWFKDYGVAFYQIQEH